MSTRLGFVVLVALALPCLHAANPAPAIPSTAEVKYTNGFETPQEAILAEGNNQGRVSIDTTQAHSGKASLKIERLNENEQVSWRSSTIGVKVGEVYRFSAWMKFDRVIMPDPSFSPEAHVLFLSPFFAGMGEQAFADSWKFQREGQDGQTPQSSDWTYHEKLFKIPPGVSAAEVIFTFSKTIGTAWLDDIRVTYEPDTVMPGDAAKSGFLMLWPARAGEKGSMRQADGSFFDPGEPVEWYVRAPEKADATKPSTVTWKIKDALDRPIDSGKTDVPAGTALPKVALPNLDAQTARWLRCDWSWDQDGHTVATRVTSILVLPKVNPYPADHFGLAFDPGDGPMFQRLGASTARCDIFWRSNNAPTPDAPINWSGRAEQQFTQSSQAGIEPLALWSWQGPTWAWLRPNGPHLPGEGWPVQPEPLKKAVIETVTKFKNYVKYWQLGNEVGLSPDERRHDYLADAKAFFEGVKQADPAAKVVLGSQNRSLNEIKQAADEGILNYCDIVDYHYGSVSLLRDLRALLDKEAPDRHIPIWQTEIATFDQGIDDSVMASAFVKLMAIDVGEGVDRSFYCGFGGGTNPGEREAGSPADSEGAYLLATSRMPSQIVASHVLCTEFFGDAVPVRTLDNGRGRGYLFHKDKKWTAVLWAEGLEPLSGQLQGLGSHVKISDWSGRHAEIDTPNGFLPLNCANRPWLVQWEADDASKVTFTPTPTLIIKSSYARLLYKGTANELSVSLGPDAPPMKMSLDAGPGVTITPSTLDLTPGEAQKVTLSVPGNFDTDRLTLDARFLNGWVTWEYRLHDMLYASPNGGPAVATDTASPATGDVIDLADKSVVRWRTPNGLAADLTPDPLGTMKSDVFCLSPGLHPFGGTTPLVENAKSISLECDVYVESSGISIGVAPPMSDPNGAKAYFFSVSSDFVGIELRDGWTGPWIGLAHTTATRPPGWVKMKFVWIKDGTLQLYLNGDLYAEAEDKRLALKIGQVEIQTNGEGRKFFTNPKIVITR